MSQITKTIPAQVTPRASDQFYGRAIVATLALAAAIIIVAIVLLRSAAAVPAAAGGSARLTDGYMSGAVSAHAAAEARSAQFLTDSWEARLNLTLATGSSGLRDGWEAGLAAPATATHDIRDGWEASLFK